MIRIFFYSMLLLPMCLHGQPVKPVERQHPTEYNIEQYYVLKTDTNVKHGRYQMIYYFGGEPMLQGFYKYGKRDSTWKEYCIWDNFIQATGKYRNDERVGEWTFYRKKNDIELKYDYTTKSVTYFSFDTGAKKYIVKGKKLEPAELERPAMYVGGKLEVMTFIAKNLKYPDSEYHLGVHGMVEVGIEIDKKGKPGRIWANKSVQKNLDAAAISTLKKLPPKWIPALYKGKTVNSAFFIEVPFVLQ